MNQPDERVQHVGAEFNRRRSGGLVERHGQAAADCSVDVVACSRAFSFSFSR
jgi:hypothetical protein